MTEYTEQATNISEQARRIIQIIRYGRREQLFLFIGAVWFFLLQKFPEFIQPIIPITESFKPIVNNLYLIGVLFIAYGVWRIWKLAIPPHLPEMAPKPTAIKGPLAFGLQDGPIFAKLGRDKDISKLLSWALDDQVNLAVLMGESGAGKSSLLRAGLEHTLLRETDKYHITPIYWEARPGDPANGLLHAVKSACPDMADKLNTLDDLLAFPSTGSGHGGRKWVMMIDQAEQLSPKRHPEIFDFLRKVAGQKPPHAVTWIIAFRRENMADWREFEIGLPAQPQFHSLKKFSAEQARAVMSLLANESQMNVEAAVLSEIAQAAAEEDEVSPVDVGIGLLVLSELERGGRSAITLDDFRAAGGAEGLLSAYIYKHLERWPDYEREGMMKALRELIDPTADYQRVADGHDPQHLADCAALPLLTVQTDLKYLAGARLLERLPAVTDRPERYRLTHERLIPALHRLTGGILGQAEQANLILNQRYQMWQREKQRRFLLTGQELTLVLKHRARLDAGKPSPARQAFVDLSRRWRTMGRGLAVLSVVAVLLTSWLGYRTWEADRHRKDLAAWGLPGDLYDKQTELKKLTLDGPVYKLDWLRGTQLEELDLSECTLRELPDRPLPTSLKTISLEFGDNICDYNSLQLPDSVKKVTLKFGATPDLATLRFPAKIDTLNLDLSSNQIQSIDQLNLPLSIQALNLDLSSNQIQSIDQLNLPRGIKTLNLDLRNNQIQNIEKLTLPQSTRLLNLYFNSNQIQSIEELNLPPGIRSLNLYLSSNQIQSIEKLILPKDLQSLNVDLRNNQIQSIEKLNLPHGIQSLNADLSSNQIKSIEKLALPQGIQSLNLTSTIIV